MDRPRQLLATMAILVAGAAAGVWIWTNGGDRGDAHEHSPETSRSEAANARGPHGGRLLEQDGFAVELALYEKGVPPELRAWVTERGKPVPLGEVNLAVSLERLGAPSERIGFRPAGEYLRGDREIAEPHSFTVAVSAERRGKSYRWQYDQFEGRIKMDDAAAARAGVEVDSAGPARIRSKLELAGEIQLDRDRVAHVVPRLAGVVVDSPRNLGEDVRRSDLLAVIESAKLADHRSDYLAARERAALAQATFERQKRLWEAQISAERTYLDSRQALAEAEIAVRSAEQKLLALGLPRGALAGSPGAALTRYEIRAPIGGTLVAKDLALGEAVKEDAAIFTIADLSTVWAEMTLYPKDLNTVQVGQSVTVRAAALGAETTGRIAYVGALVGGDTRSAKARATIKNPDRRWRPGLFVTVEVVADEVEVPVAVKTSAVQTLGDRPVVFGRWGGAFEARPVELGRADGERVEIVKGLAAGARYAATGSFVLKAELGKAGTSHDH